MDEPIHIAITRRVSRAHVAEFEGALAEFASQSLAEPGMRGVHVLYPPQGSSSLEYGILRSFASTADRDAFYASPVYRAWVRRIEPWVEGEPSYRPLQGLEAFFRTPASPPRWKMAVLTWIAVWPVSLLVPALLSPLIGGRLPTFLAAGVIGAGIVIVLTWVAMPLLVRAAEGFLHPHQTTEDKHQP